MRLGSTFEITDREERTITVDVVDVPRLLGALGRELILQQLHEASAPFAAVHEVTAPEEPGT